MRLNRRFAALFAIGAAVAVPMVGCGGGSDDNSTSNAATQASPRQRPVARRRPARGTVNLTATDFKFNPSDPTVKSGEVTFNLKNDGQVTHSLEIEDVNGQDQELEGEVSPGQSGTLKVNLPPGKYEFYCPVGQPQGDGHGGRDHRQVMARPPIISRGEAPSIRGGRSHVMAKPSTKTPLRPRGRRRRPCRPARASRGRGVV